MQAYAIKEYKRWFGLKRFFRVDWWMIKYGREPKNEFYKMVKLTKAFEHEKDDIWKYQALLFKTLRIKNGMKVVELEEPFTRALNKLSTKTGSVCQNRKKKPIHTV